jgi:hypothetical protein
MQAHVAHATADSAARLRGSGQRGAGSVPAAWYASGAAAIDARGRTCPFEKVGDMLGAHYFVSGWPCAAGQLVFVPVQRLGGAAVAARGKFPWVSMGFATSQLRSTDAV